MTSGSTDVRDVDLARVGHDKGQVVLEFVRLLPCAPDELRAGLVRSALRAPDHAPSPQMREGETTRWDIEKTDTGSRLSLTAWINGEDIEGAADQSAYWHLRFEDLIRTAVPSAAAEPDGHLARGHLADHYSSALAAALADAD